MSDSFTKKAKNYLKSNQGDLQTVFSKIKALEEINKRVQRYLAPELQKYCQVANFTSYRLVILAANGSIATQVRFLTADLLLAFEKDTVLSKFKEIQCKVRPVAAQGRTARASRAVTKLSTDTAEIVRDIAESIEDPRLRELLIKISQHKE